jgi:Concanavalin A-like lectin/glucanases superfamily
MTLAMAGLMAALVLVAPARASETAVAAGYDAAVLADSPTAFWRMDRANTASEPDLSGSGLTGAYAGTRTRTTLPNGELAARFDGDSGYLQVRDHAAVSPATRGVLTIEAWMRPDTLQFPRDERAGYVHWMGKGEPGQHEYVSRMYSLVNDDDRPNRISGYSFNLAGDRGAGSYFEDDIVAGEWIHYVLVINANAKSPAFPNGYTKIYRDGMMRDQDDLSIDGNVIVPRRGSAPFRVGTRDFVSWFLGAVGKVAIYQKELSQSRIAIHCAAMLSPACSNVRPA